MSEQLGTCAFSRSTEIAVELRTEHINPHVQRFTCVDWQTVELNWISVTDEMPRPNHYPLLTTAKAANSDVRTFQTAWYSRVHGRWYAYPSDKSLRLDVTHWMNIDSLLEVAND